MTETVSFPFLRSVRWLTNFRRRLAQARCLWPGSSSSSWPQNGFKISASVLVPPLHDRFLQE